MARSILLAVCAFRQFPYPIPDSPPSTPPSLFECICIVWMLVALMALLLPRPWFIALTKIVFPFLPEKLEDWDKK
jgi:hypothetical protein